MIDVGNNVNEEYQNIYQQNFKPDAHKKSLSLCAREEDLFFRCCFLHKAYPKFLSLSTIKGGQLCMKGTLKEL